MFKKLFCAVLCLSMIFICGCSNSKQIDKASLAETVTVSEVNGKLTYTFYLLSGEDKPQGVSVIANSFREACTLAKEIYIPDLRLEKFELLVVNEKIYSRVLKNDLKYMSEKSFFSPLSYVTLCDENTIKIIEEDKKAPEQIEEYILLLKNKNDDVNINSLSVYNSFAENKGDEICISYINFDNELKVSYLKINL